MGPFTFVALAVLLPSNGATEGFADPSCNSEGSCAAVDGSAKPETGAEFYQYQQHINGKTIRAPSQDNKQSTDPHTHDIKVDITATINGEAVDPSTHSVTVNGEADDPNKHSAAPECPYAFEKPSCETAGVQAPRDVSDGAEGLKSGSFAPLNNKQRQKLGQTNVHFHYGAEHYSEGQYMNFETSQNRLHTADKIGKDHVGLAQERQRRHTKRSGLHEPLAYEGGGAGGWMCNASHHSLDEYVFQYCRDVEVGKTYEIHYVFSGAGNGADINEHASLTDGLGQAANGRNLLNPHVTVQAQVFFIVNGGEYDPTFDDMVHGWQKTLASDDSVMYAGSTTGTSHDNNVCSPYSVSWHVDRKCHAVAAASFDKMCKDMKEKYGLNHDLEPHGSRTLVDKKYVVPWAEVDTFE